MDYTDAYLFFCLIFFFFGGIFVAIGVFLLRRDGKQKRCRCLLRGKVADFKRVSCGGGYRGGKMYTWKPRFSYTYNDKEYNAETSYSTVFKRFKAGDEADIYIDEAHPEVFWIPSEARVKKRLGLAFLAAGVAIWLLLALLALGPRLLTLERIPEPPSWE
ncbi:MAG: hypothetical protein Q4F00_08120 [bacterium]|nr:hypothetical protein [bacterium]